MMRRNTNTATLRNYRGTSTITVKGNRMILAFTPSSGDREKVAFVMPQGMVRQVLDLCHSFNADISAAIGEYIGGCISNDHDKAIWYHYGKDEFGEVEQYKTKCFVSLYGYCTGDGVFLNFRIKTDNRQFTVQYDLKLWNQREAVREITRQLMSYK